MGGGTTTINGSSCTGSVRAINPATGAFIWQTCFTSGHVLGAITTANGIVAVAHGKSLSLLNATSGASLFQYTDTNASSNFYGAVTIADGKIYVGNMDGNLYVFA